MDTMIAKHDDGLNNSNSKASSVVLSDTTNTLPSEGRRIFWTKEKLSLLESQVHLYGCNFEQIIQSNPIEFRKKTPSALYQQTKKHFPLLFDKKKSALDNSHNTINDIDASTIVLQDTTSTVSSLEEERKASFWTRDKLNFLKSQVQLYACNWKQIILNNPTEFQSKTPNALYCMAKKHFPSFLNEHSHTKVHWTSEELQLLDNLVNVHGNDWKKISQSFPNRSLNSISVCALRRKSMYRTRLIPRRQQTHRAFVEPSPLYKTSEKWSEEEKQILRDEILCHGRDWKKVSEALPGRSRVACESFARRVVTEESLTQCSKKRKRGLRSKWSEEEDNKLLLLQEEYQNDWKTISGGLKNYDKKTCYNRFKYLKRQNRTVSDVVVRKRQRVLSDDDLSKKFRAESVSVCKSVRMNNTLECIVCNSVSHQFAPRRYCSACNFVIHTYCAFTAYSGVNDLSDIKFDCCDNCKKMVRYYANHCQKEEVLVDGKTAMNERRLFLRAMLNVDMEDLKNDKLQQMLKLYDSLNGMSLDDKTTLKHYEKAFDDDSKVIGLVAFTKMWNLMSEKDQRATATRGFFSVNVKQRFECPVCKSKKHVVASTCIYKDFMTHLGSQRVRHPKCFVFLWNLLSHKIDGTVISTKKSTSSNKKSSKVLSYGGRVRQLFFDKADDNIGSEEYVKAYDNKARISSRVFNKIWSWMSPSERTLAADVGFTSFSKPLPRFICPECEFSTKHINGCKFNAFFTHKKPIITSSGPFVFLWKRLKKAAENDPIEEEKSVSTPLDIIKCPSTQQITSTSVLDNIEAAFKSKRMHHEEMFESVMLSSKVISMLGRAGAAFVWSWMTLEECQIVRDKGFFSFKMRECPACSFGHNHSTNYYHEKSCLFKAFLKRLPRLRPGGSTIKFLWHRIKQEALKSDSNVKDVLETIVDTVVLEEMKRFQEISKFSTSFATSIVLQGKSKVLLKRITCPFCHTTDFHKSVFTRNCAFYKFQRTERARKIHMSYEDCVVAWNAFSRSVKLSHFD